jgi:ISXO2-like transposase domain/Transposase zinc-ribbon domain
MSEKQLGKLTVKEFFARFPDDDACLNHIMEVRYGMRHVCQVCGVEGTFHKLTARRAFSCAHCGDHLYPCAGTIFQDSRTSLQTWFYAIYLFVTTRHGVSGKELERTLGVTYKTAWRMGQQIRKLMARADGFELMRGHIEADSTWIGGRRPQPHYKENKTIVHGLKERGGRIAAEVVRDETTPTLRRMVARYVEEGSTVSTDEHVSYGLLSDDGYIHGRVKHSAYEFVRGEHHTNNVENFWRLFKNSIRSTHIHVSRKYMNRYLREFTFRANHRGMQNAMFDLLIAAV